MKKISIFTLILIAAAFFFWREESLEKKSVVVELNNESSAHSYSSSHSSSFASYSQSEKTLTADAKSSVDNNVIAGKLKVWAHDRGYDTSSGGVSDYDSYDPKLLSELSKQGDVKAMMRLGDYYLKKNMRAEAVNVYRDAIVNGATLPVVALATLELPIKSEFVDENEKAKAFHHSLAYYKFADLRGDSLTSSTMFKNTIKIYNLTLSEKDYADIDKIAGDLYSKYQEERERIGLGAFDNRQAIAQ